MTFTLFPSPDDNLWLEIVRNHDGAILSCDRFDGGDADFLVAVESWFDEIIAGVVNDMEIEACQACNGRRPSHIDEDGCLVIESDVAGVEWRFDLCTPCAEHLIRTNPWVLKE